MTGKHLLWLLPALAVMAQAQQSINQSTNQLPEVVVTGNRSAVEKSALSPQAEASPASVTVLTPQEVERQNVVSYGDLFRPVSGMNVSNYGQGGVGYGLAMRGFPELEHGRDMAYTIDGMPVNSVSSPHVNGYSDLNPLLPELVQRMEITRGPFNPRFGSYALGGSVNIMTEDRPSSALYASGGSFDEGRGLGVYSFGSESVYGYGSLEGKTIEGYRRNSSQESINSFDKISFPMLNGTGSVRVQAYSTDFDAPGYLDRDLVRAGLLSPRAAINKADGGSMTMENIVFNYRQADKDQETFGALYLNHDLFKRFATYNLTPDPTGQSLQADDRITTGGSLDHYWTFDLPRSMSAGLLAGGGFRADFAQVDKFNTFDRRPIAQTAAFDFDQYNPFTYVQADFKPLDWLKFTGGVRFDDFSYSVDESVSGRSVSPETYSLSPKGGVVVTPMKELEFFGNVGQGIRPPSAVDDLLGNPKLGVAEQWSEEIGLQSNDPDGRWHALASVYHTELSNEIQIGPDGFTPVNLGQSRREGFEVEGRYRIFHEQTKSVYLVASFSGVDARLIHTTDGSRFVPGVASSVASFGLEMEFPWLEEGSPHRLFFTGLGQMIGEKKITSDGSEVTEPYSRVSFKLSYLNTKWKNLSAFVGVIAYPDSRLEEAAFDFGGGKVGVSPVAPVTVQGGFSIRL